ncbi:hypothetical protein lbkm_2241 [Lachnospiraceae bacterium KM106-2]|nr:hypothetical protein lbkm_2241 [Lachnospiraceae bacterium KM106-2]
MIINWITIHVKSLEKSKEFYSGYLGLKLKDRMLPNEMMTIEFYEAENGMQVELIESKSTEYQIANNAGISIGIASKNYETLLGRARELNILYREPQMMGPMECFFVKDPDAISIQIIK